jgi:hypothetical protein
VLQKHAIIGIAHHRETEIDASLVW